jgi:thiol-disulfide isomerase/thioredoxin
VDRLPAVSTTMKRFFSIGLLALLSGCDDTSAAATPQPEGRVVAVAASGKQATESDLCDVHKPAGEAPSFAFPPLDGAAPPQGPGYRWVNVWATWCPPCTEELPLLARFRDQLNQAGTRVELLFMSVDQTPEVITTFREKHPEVGGSLRVTEPSQLEAWLTSIGLDKGAPLPIHVFVDPAGKVRCARTGALRESDFPLLKQLLSGS